jgi:uncharacterized membrane protein YdbT with pleckstrin-like domain
MLTANTTLSVKPAFVGWLTLLMQLPYQLFMTVWSGVFFGQGISQATGAAFWPPAMLIGTTVFVAMPVVIYTVKKLNYARTEYRFYADRVEFEEGFFSINKKVVNFRDVKEVTLRKGFLQQFCGLGTVYLLTLATGVDAPVSPFARFGFGSVSASGVIVRDIPNPDDAYDAIKKLVNARNA